jgi:LEA14-like dessication related protein
MEPEVYLGTQVKKWYISSIDDPEKVRWAVSSENYAKQAVADVEIELQEVYKCLPT